MPAKKQMAKKEEDFNEDDLYLDDDTLDDDGEPDGNPDDTNNGDQILSQLEEQKKINEELTKQLDYLKKKVEPESKKVDEDAPKIPDKPLNYDVKEAYTDPASESFRWRASAELALKEYEQKRMFAAIGEMVDQKLSLHNKAKQIDEMERDLKSERKLSDKDLDGFKEWMQSENNLNLSELFDVYQKRTGKIKDVTDNRSSLPNIDMFPGGYEPTDEDKEFEKGLLGNVSGRHKRY